MELDGTDSNESGTTETDTTTESSKSTSQEAPVEHRSMRSALRANLKQESEQEAPAEGAQEQKAQAPTQSTQQTAPVTEAVAPPADMTKEEQAQFSKLTPEMQKYISRRAYETRNYLTRATEELKRGRAEVEGISQAVSKYQGEYAKMGVSMPDLVRRSVEWDREIRSKGAPALVEFLEAYGYSPEDLIGSRGEGAQQTTQQQGSLTREEAMDLARQEIAREMQRQAQVSSTNQAKTTIDSFVASKPLFRDPGTAEQLEAEMAPWVHALSTAMPNRPLPEVLEEAYGLAVSKNPVFAELNAKLSVKPAIERTNAEAQKARAASRSISGGPGSGSPTRKPESFREALRLHLTGGA